MAQALSWALPHTDCGMSGVFATDKQKGSVLQLTSVPGSISTREMYKGTVVCFADIPVSDLEIHMRKYGLVGISFLKTFLLQRGANPVFYNASESVGRRGTPRGEYFD